MTSIYFVCSLAVLFVASSVWFAVLAYRTDRRQNSPYDWSEDALDFVNIVSDEREGVMRHWSPASPDASPPPDRRGTRVPRVAPPVTAAPSLPDAPQPQVAGSPSSSTTEGPGGRHP